jgi:hypothetical protein
MFILINMPNHSIQRPCLPLALFKALFKQENLPSRVLDLNLLLASCIGTTRYGFIESSIQMLELVNGLWGPHIWGSSFLQDARGLYRKASCLSVPDNRHGHVP